MRVNDTPYLYMPNKRICITAFCVEICDDATVGRVNRYLLANASRRSECESEIIPKMNEEQIERIAERMFLVSLCLLL